MKTQIFNTICDSFDDYSQRYDSDPDDLTVGFIDRGGVFYFFIKMFILTGSRIRFRFRVPLIIPMNCYDSVYKNIHSANKKSSNGEFYLNPENALLEYTVESEFDELFEHSELWIFLENEIAHLEDLLPKLLSPVFKEIQSQSKSKKLVKA